MEILVKVKIENLFKAKDFTDSKSGETTEGKWKIQTFDNVETENGMQMNLMNISVPEEVAEKFKTKIGETVTIPVGTFVNKNRVGFYGI